MCSVGKKALEIHAVLDGWHLYQARKSDFKTWFAHPENDLYLPKITGYGCEVFQTKYHDLDSRLALYTENCLSQTIKKQLALSTRDVDFNRKYHVYNAHWHHQSGFDL